MWDRDITDEEFRERLIFSLVGPLVRAARWFNLPLRDLLHWVKLAYFQELRDEGLTLKEIGEAMEVSVPTAARLSRGLKTNFYRPEREHQLPQRLEFMLWAGPLSRARIHQCLPHQQAEAIDVALARMGEEGRIQQTEDDPPLFRVTSPRGRLVKDSWYVRIGSLDSLLDNLSDTIAARLLEGREDAFARTLNLRVPRARLGALKELYENTIWPRLVALDEEAQNVPERDEVRLSLFWCRGAPPPEGEEERR